jgi:Flp pilus assembly protein TadD
MNLRAVWSVVGLSAVLAGCQAQSLVHRSGLTPEEAREARLENAMQGLLYTEDNVVPDPAYARPRDLEAALISIGRGEALLGSNRTIEGVESFVQAVLLAPDLPPAYSGLGRALVRKGKHPEALGCFRTALGLGADPVEHQFMIGDVLQRLGRVEAAIATWREVIAVAPDHGLAHGRLASILFVTGDYGAARSHLAEAMALGAPVPSQVVAALLGAGVPTTTVADGPPAGETSATADVTVGPQVRVNVGGGSSRCNETTAAAVDAAKGEAVTGWNDYRDPGAIRNGFGVTLDGGKTWTDMLVRPPAQYQDDVEGDPMTAFDPRTGTLWAGGISFSATGGIFVARKNPGEAVFQPPVMTHVGSVDKGWMAAGVVPGQAGSTRLHLAYDLGYQWSDDLGATWSSVRFIAVGIGFLPRVGPDGTLYVAYWDYYDGVMLLRSPDGGVTFDPPIRIATRIDPDMFDGYQFPGSFRVPGLSYLAVDPNDGTLYCLYFDTTFVVGAEHDVDLYWTVSHDHGSTWAPASILDVADTGDQFFPWLEVDSSGRLHLLFYDTRNTVQSDTDPVAFIDAYYAWSDDEGASWTQHRLTPAPFSSADVGYSFLGDYLGLGVGHGQVYPAYLAADGSAPAIFSHQIRWDQALFADDFESGSLSAWSVVVP